MNETGHWQLNEGSRVLKTGQVQYSANTWHALMLTVKGTSVEAAIDGVKLANVPNVSQFVAGWAALGSGYNYAQFDNFYVAHAKSEDLNMQQEY